jgi:hypothetical protein
MNLLFADFLSLDFFYPDKPKTTTTIISAQVLKKFFFIVVVFSVLDRDVKMLLGNHHCCKAAC